MTVQGKAAAAGAEGDPVVVEHPSELSLLGLLMRDMLTAGMAQEGAVDRVRSLWGDVRVQAGDMIVTLRFERGQVRIVEGGSPAPRASVRGTMAGLLVVARGGSLLSPLLSGAVKVGGNPFVLLRILPLLRASSAAGEPPRGGNGEVE